MTAKLNEDIAQAVSRQDRPLEVCDAAGNAYIVMTSQQFQKYVYDDTELTPGEMAAAAALPRTGQCASGDGAVCVRVD